MGAWYRGLVSVRVGVSKVYVSTGETWVYPAPCLFQSNCNTQFREYITYLTLSDSARFRYTRNSPHDVSTLFSLVLIFGSCGCQDETPSRPPSLRVAPLPHIDSLGSLGEAAVAAIGKGSPSANPLVGGRCQYHKESQPINYRRRREEIPAQLPRGSPSPSGDPLIGRCTLYRSRNESDRRCMCRQGDTFERNGRPRSNREVNASAKNVGNVAATKSAGRAVIAAQPEDGPFSLPDGVGEEGARCFSACALNCVPLISRTDTPAPNFWCSR